MVLISEIDSIDDSDNNIDSSGWWHRSFWLIVSIILINSSDQYHYQYWLILSKLIYQKRVTEGKFTFLMLFFSVSFLELFGIVIDRIDSSDWFHHI